MLISLVNYGDYGDIIVSTKQGKASTLQQYKFAISSHMQQTNSSGVSEVSNEISR